LGFSRLPCLATIPVMLNTYMNFVAASNNEMQILPQLYTHQYHSLK
jgi:hypothetical protein